MMWRMLAIYLVAEEARNAKGGPQVGFVLEQPADPRKTCLDARPFGERPSGKHLRRWKAWPSTSSTRLRRSSTKPTTLGTNLYIDLPERRVTGLVSRARMEEVDLRDSKNLARWAPGLMREVARAILTQVRKQVVKLRKLSWQEHIAQDIAR